MPIIPWRPRWDIDRWFEEEWEDLDWPRWGLRLPMIRTPRMDIYEEGNNVIAKIELPGVDPKNINVQVKDNILQVEAKREEKKEEKEKGYYRKEISSGIFKRAVSLPTEVIGEKAEASYEDGILKVTVPKTKQKIEEKKSIPIKVKSKTK